MRRPRRRDDDVRRARDVGQVAGFDVRDHHRRLALQQQHRHRLADDVRLADHHHVQPAIVVDHAVEQLHDPKRRAGHQPTRAGRQPPDVDRVEPVDILVRPDAIEHPRRVDRARQRQLHQNAMHRRIGVQPIDQRQHIGLGRLGGQAVLDRAHANAAAFGDLAADVDVAGRIVAHQHHRQRRLDPARLQCRHRLGRFGGQGPRHCGAIDDLGHGWSPPLNAGVVLTEPSRPVKVPLRHEIIRDSALAGARAIA